MGGYRRGGRPQQGRWSPHAGAAGLPWFAGQQSGWGIPCQSGHQVVDVRGKVVSS
jgi:hypothetical protein